MRARRHGSLRRMSVLLTGAVLSVLVGVLGQVPSGTPALAAPAVGGLGASGPVEVEGARTRTSATFRREDGSMVTRVSAGAMHFRSGGAWERVDNRLAEQPDGTVGTVATGYDIELPVDLTEPVSVQKAGDGVAFSLQDAEAGERSVDGATATYADVMPGVDVDYTAGPDQVKEELVLEGPDAQRSFAFDLDPAGGATPRLDDAGGVELVGPDGSVGARIAPPVMADADGETSRDLDYELGRAADGGWTLGLDADTKWLRAQDRAWPIKVDPTVYFGSDISAQLDDPQGGADTPFGQQPYFEATGAGDRVRRGLVRFNLSGIPRSATVTNGNVNLRSYAGHPSNTAVGVQLFQLTRSFTQAGARWSHSGTAAWDAPGGDVKAQALDTQTVNGATENWQVFYAGNAIQEWVRDPASNHGLQLRVQTENQASGVGWYSVWAAANHPFLEVEWEDALGSKPNWTFDEIGLSDRSGLSVNVATGNLIYTGNDVDITGVGGMDLTVDRSYNSRDWRGPAGQSWMLGFGLDTRVYGHNNGQTRILSTPDHAQWRFEKTGSTWKTPPALNATMTDDANGIRLLFHRSGETWYFPNAGGNRLGWRENNNGHRISYAYNGSGDLTQITDTHGRAYTIAYAGGRPTTITDATYPGGARTWQYGYTTTGGTTNLTSYTDPAGKTTSYTYEAGGSDLTRITDARGNRIKLTYSYAIDPSGEYPRVTSIQRMTNTDWNNPVGPKWTYAYDLAGKTTTVTAPNGNVSGGTPSQHQTTYHWNETSLQVEYVKNRLGQWEQTDRSQNGDVTKFTSQGAAAPGGTGGGTGTAAVTDVAYSNDGNNNPTERKAPGVSGAAGGARETSLSSYYGASDTHGGQPASPATGQYRQKTGTDEQGNITNFEYDAAGNLAKAAQGPAVQANLAYTTAADAPVPRGLLKTATDGKGQTTAYTHSAAGDLTAVKPPLTGGIHPGEYSYTYEAQTNRRKTQTDASGVTLTYSYDKLDRVTSIANSNGQTVSYGYDNNGNLISRTWAGTTIGGANATYVYDALNRRTSETIAGVTTTYTYDANGNLATMVDGGGATSYGYDRLDRVNQITPPAGGAITAAYEDTPVKRTRTWTYPGGQQQRVDYALSGKTLGVTALNSTNGVIKSLDYDYAGPTSGSETFLRRSETQKTGTTTDRTFTYAYDTNNRLCWATTQTIATGPFTIGACPNAASAPAGAGITTWSYEWDAASNRTRTSSNVNTAFTRNETFSHNPANQLAGYSHDSRGNLTNGSLGYDVWNRLVTVGATTLHYGTPDNTELVTDGAVTLRNTQLGMTTSTTGGTATHYIRTPDGEFVGERTSAGTRYAILDALGSTRWLLSGNTISRAYDYSPDGVPTITGGSGTDTRIRYAGGDYTTSGRYHFGARFYDSYLARWTQRDPLDRAGSPIGAAPYTYADACPTSLTDPSGLVPSTGGGGGGSTWTPSGSVRRARDNCEPIRYEYNLGSYIRTDVAPARSRKYRGGTSYYVRYTNGSCHVIYRGDKIIHKPHPTSNDAS